MLHFAPRAQQQPLVGHCVGPGGNQGWERGDGGSTGGARANDSIRAPQVLKSGGFDCVAMAWVATAVDLPFRVSGRLQGFLGMGSFLVGTGLCYLAGAATARLPTPLQTSLSRWCRFTPPAGACLAATGMLGRMDVLSQNLSCRVVELVAGFWPPRAAEAGVVPSPFFFLPFFFFACKFDSVSI